MHFSSEYIIHQTVKEENMNFFKRIKQFVLPFKLKFFGAYILIALQCIAKLYSPKITNLIIDKALSESNVKELYHYIFLLCIAFAISELCRVFQMAFLVNIGENMTINLRCNLYKAITGASVQDVREKETGDIISRIVNEIPSVSEFYTRVIPSLFTNIFVLFVGIIMMCILDYRCTMVTILILPAIYFATKYFSPQIKNITKQGAELNAQFISLAEQIINNLIIIKHNHVYGYSDRCFEMKVNDIKKNKYDLTKYNIIMSTVLTIITFIPNVFIMVWGGKMVLNSNMTIGTLVALNSYVGFLISPVVYFAQSAISFQQNEVIIKRYEEIVFKYDTYKKDNLVGTKEIKEFDNLIFCNVKFNYGNKTLLENLNFEIKAGEIVQIIGRNGTGKTTLINLLTGLLKPISGEILINNQNISLLNLEKIICVVTQENHFFEDTVENNILLDRIDLKENILPVASELDYLDIISSDTLNLKSKLNSKGNNISGGQAQKINIMRSLILNSPVVVFDEVDTFLDQKSKQAIYKYINLHQEKTFVFISHEIIENITVDKIIYL